MAPSADPGGGAMSAVLEVEGLRTEFRLRHSTVVAVDDVSFRIEEGECVGMVGESGCGKTSVGLSIMRLLPNVGHVTAGAVRLMGEDVVALSEREMWKRRGENMGMVFQDPLTCLNPTMTVGRQIAESLRVHRGVSRKAARLRALEVLDLVDMPQPLERLRAYPHELSGGLRQRVMIAMALACEPKLLIADEPTTALDVTIQAQILDLLDSLRQELNMAVLLITHDMGVIAGRADRVLVMYAGKIVEAASTEEVFTRMRHPYSEALLASVPRLDQEASVRLVSIPGVPPDLSQPIPACRFAPRCRYVESDCRQADPPLAPADASEPDHVASCFHQVGADATRVASPLAVDRIAVERPVRVDGEVPSPEGVPISAGDDAPVLLRLDHVVKEFPVSSGGVLRRSIGSIKAVSDVSFTVRQGQTFGLVGESGSGKTTIGRMVVLLERATRGRIQFRGEAITELRGGALRARRRNLQIMFQDPYASLDPRMRVRTILCEPLLVQGIGDRKSRDRRVGELLDEVGLPRGSLERYPHEFSGGQRQRIGLARALTLDPELIVADEPVSALDVSIQAQILNLLKDLQTLHRLTFIFISHDLAVVKYMADTIGVMYSGKLMEIGPARVIYEKPAHPYTRVLIDTIPVADVHKGRAMRGKHVEGELPSAMNPPSGCRFRTRCPFVREICALEEPAFRSFGDRHLAACHFPLETPRVVAVGGRVLTVAPQSEQS